MTYFEALLYGAVQGLTEYLPISSSAHLILLPKFLNKADPGLTFDVFMHLGTLLATVIYFWREWFDILMTVPGMSSVVQGYQRRSKLPGVSWKLIVIATLPALLAGALLHGLAEEFFRGNKVLMMSLVVGGIALWLSDIFSSQKKDLGRATWKDAFWVGVAQCFALIPGFSRSGSTMTGGRFLGFDRAEAARFSFLISAPVTGAAVVFEFRNYKDLLAGMESIGPLVMAGLGSFLFGCLAIGGLLRLLRRFGFLSFAVYRLALAIVIFAYLGI